MNLEHSQNETLNIVADILRAVVFSLASASRSDMGEIADAMEGLSSSPQFDPKATAVLKQLAAEFGQLRSHPESMDRER